MCCCVLHVRPVAVLQELHMSWDSETADLGLNAGAFQGLSKLQRLQSLMVNFRVSGCGDYPVAIALFIESC